MMLDEQKYEIKKQLEKELASIHFSSNEKVLKQTHPHTFFEKLNYWWNKEVEIPIVPVTTVIVILIGIKLTTQNFDSQLDFQKQESPQQRQLVKVAGNIYWNDLLDEDVRR